MKFFPAVSMRIAGFFVLIAVFHYKKEGEFQVKSKFILRFTSEFTSLVLRTGIEPVRTLLSTGF